jgi:hypothetical protein
MEFNRHGWAISPPVEPLSTDRAYTLLAPEPSSRMDIAVWAHKARTFFGASVELCQAKAYPEGETPERDAAVVEIARGKAGPKTRLWVVTLPIEEVPEARAAGEAGARAIGGAGMDLLVERARRAWQIKADVPEGGDPGAPLALAALLSSVLLAPIVPPGGGTIFGVKGARERLGLS